MRRIDVKKEPSSKQPRWIVIVGKDDVYYCRTKAMTKKIREHLIEGETMKIFKATYNFIEAWKK